MWSDQLFVYFCIEEGSLAGKKENQAESNTVGICVPVPAVYMVLQLIDVSLQPFSVLQFIDVSLQPFNICKASLESKSSDTVKLDI